MNFSSNKKNPTITFDRRLFDEKVCKLLDVGGCGEDEYDKNYKPAPSAILSLIETTLVNKENEANENVSALKATIGIIKNDKKVADKEIKNLTIKLKEGEKKLQSDPVAQVVGFNPQIAVPVTPTLVHHLQ